jgi:hypothetical protein
MRCVIIGLVYAIGLGCSGKQTTTSAGATTSARSGRADSSSATKAPPSKSPETKTEPRMLRPFEGITVILDEVNRSRVEVAARVCLDEGFLEQVACAPRSREHESLLVVTPGRPNQVHAALLMAGFNAGRPGQWLYEESKIKTAPPTGDKLDVWVRYSDASGKVREHPVRQWIRGAVRIIGDNQPPPDYPEFPAIPWVFGGSATEANPPFMGPGEHYVADMTGSIIGLVTFGDEIIGLSQVLSDQEDVQAPVWEVNSETIPPMGTNVTLILKKWRE